MLSIQTRTCVVLQSVAAIRSLTLQPGSLAWCRSWLLTAVADYYGACIRLCGVIVCSESSVWAAVLWVIACLCLGTPACCAWVMVRLCRHGTLALQRATHGATAWSGEDGVNAKTH